ncbi:MAG: D-alanyl-D-alanine carboxypeptidase [Alphaproteobacteria bacterium]|nr:D-alanyl-D-alanine carboxypeptidase [Alphaproteobacteria bacterium]
MGTLKARIGIFYCFLTVFCIINTSSLWAVKSAAIVICAETGKIHHEKNADAITHPASLTKMMTLYLTFNAIREGRLTFNQHLPVSKRATLVQPSKLWLKAGSTISVRDAILALVTKSANDASVVLAEALGNGSETQFATKMTQQARYLGMSNTVFKNAHGLPHIEQVTTARDMATLSRCLYKHFPEYFKFFKEAKFVYKGQVHANHNHLLGRVPGVDGIKTGFINASGFNLAASMVRGNHRIIAVVMGGESVKSRDNKMAKLLEATHSFLTGKKGVLQKNQYCSIEDLLGSLEPPQTTSLKEKIYKAEMRGRCGPAKIITTKYIKKYKSVDDLLLASFQEEDARSPLRKKVLKSPPQAQKKKNPNKLPKSKTKKVVGKKPASKKTSKKGRGRK